MALNELAKTVNQTMRCLNKFCDAETKQFIAKNQNQMKPLFELATKLDKMKDSLSEAKYKKEFEKLTKAFQKASKKAVELKENKSLQKCSANKCGSQHLDNFKVLQKVHANDCKKKDKKACKMQKATESIVKKKKVTDKDLIKYNKLAVQ